jgi:hypothetical protein
LVVMPLSPGPKAQPVKHAAVVTNNHAYQSTTAIRRAAQTASQAAQVDARLRRRAWVRRMGQS